MKLPKYVNYNIYNTTVSEIEKWFTLTTVHRTVYVYTKAYK